MFAKSGSQKIERLGTELDLTLEMVATQMKASFCTFALLSIFQGSWESRERKGKSSLRYHRSSRKTFSYHDDAGGVAVLVETILYDSEKAVFQKKNASHLFPLYWFTVKVSIAFV